MIYAITGTEPDFLGFALFDQFEDLNIDLVSASSTTIVLNNSDTGAVTTLTGSGFTFSGDTPTGGTITGISVNDGGNTIGSLSDISWNLVAFDNALEALDNGNEGPIANLFNSSGPITIDASGATGFINAENDLEGIFDLLNSGFTYIDSPFDEDVGGTDFNDTYVVGTHNDFNTIFIEATLGNDTFDVTGASSNTFMLLDYDQDYSTPRAITVNINGDSNTGTISTSNFTDTITGLGTILAADGLGITGSALNDTFNVSLGGQDDDSYQWMFVRGGEGVDNYNITLDEDSGLRISFIFGANIDPFTGVVLNLETGMISNDGFGNAETLNYTNTGGRLEVQGTFLTDNITGSDFGDSFILQTGNDTVDGGDGFDRVRYDRSGVEAVMVNLTTGVATGTWSGDAFTHDLTSIEWVRGSREGNDTLIGSGKDERLDGRGGDDSLEGGTGNDNLEGGAGNDTLRGGNQFDTLRGGDGNDSLYGGNGRDLVFGDNGNDRFIDNGQGGDLGRDTVFGGNGNDTLLARGGNDAVHGNQGNDSIEGGDGNDQLFGGDQYDTIRGGNGNDTIWGGNGRDLVFGGNGNDVFNDNGQGGVNGQDTVFGHGGNDTLRGGGGNDALHGNQGNDSIEGGNGNDMLYGGLNYDTIRGGNGNDTVWGGDGRDLVFLGNGNDVFNDNGQGGVNGQDTVFGGNGNDTLNGGGGNDNLNGNAGNDRIFGGNGNDRVFGGLDNDTMTGGIGVDTFVYNDGADIVTDFGTGPDRLQIDDALWFGTLSASQVVNTFASVQGGDVVFNFGGGNTLTLDGVNSTAGLDNILTIV